MAKVGPNYELASVVAVEESIDGEGLATKVTLRAGMRAGRMFFVPHDPGAGFGFSGFS